MKTKYEQLIAQNKSIREISDELKLSYTTVRYWIKKYGLKTNSKWASKRQKIFFDRKAGVYTCPKCNINKEVNNDNFYLRSNGHFHRWCKDCNNKFTYEKQLQRKRAAVEYKGGKCYVCGYNKYVGALDFHHLDPETKDYNIAQLRSYSFDAMKEELDKCVLLCKNCHSETHHGLIDPKKLDGPTGYDPVTSFL